MPYKKPEDLRRAQREWCRARRQAFFNGKRCARCGGTEALELDHVDPEKKVSHKIWSWSDDRRDAEIAKCQVLCGECHLLKTFGRPVGARAEHGTRSRYRSGCKCGPCRKANVDYKDRVVAAAHQRRVSL
jgi:hypothetical protein